MFIEVVQVTASPLFLTGYEAGSTTPVRAGKEAAHQGVAGQIKTGLNRQATYLTNLAATTHLPPARTMKRISIILGVLATVLLVAFFVMRSVTKSGSPEAIAQISQDGLSVQVTYCRPYKKGRTIFGGLVPYQKVWRTGANEATVIEFSKPVTIMGKPLKAGKYSLWSVPFPNGWQAIFNRETGQWGTNYDYTQDALRVMVNTRPHSPVAEQFTISFAPTAGGPDMILAWDKTEAVIPIRQ
jgi:hypothetical protein